MDGHNSIPDDDFLRDFRNLTSVVDPFSGTPADHITHGGLSTNPKVAELLDWISDIARKDVKQEGGFGLPQEEVPPGGVSLDGAMPGRAPLEEVPLEQPVSPKGAPLDVPQAGALPLQ